MELSPIWNCSKINEGQVRAYGLDDVIELKDPGSEEALFKKCFRRPKSAAHGWGSCGVQLSRINFGFYKTE